MDIQTAVEVPLRVDEGGVIRIGESRVTLDAIIADFRRGASPEAIAHHFPVLDLSQVYLVVGYYLQNRESVDAYLTEQQQLAQQARQDFQQAFAGDNTLRTKLLNELTNRQKPR
ncbi:MAG: DUF433 domain-containing protein [Anaerolineae bacterium]|nr:DUF433 domain-containing protein [Anaerolineae bacterium]